MNFYSVPRFEIEEESPEELARYAAEAKEAKQRRWQHEAQKQAEWRRQEAEQAAWLEKRTAEAQAERRRESERQAQHDAILEARHRAAVADAELKEFMLAAKQAPAADDASPEAVLEALASRFFDANNPPVAVLRLGDATICTPGNLSNVQAPAKAGKSAVIGAILAAFMNQGQDCDTLGFSSSNPEGKAVLHVDTEQSRYDHHALIARSLRRAGIAEPPPWLVSASLADLSVAARREAVRTLMEKAAASFGGILAVIIDGVADLVNDPNDAAESFALVAELHKLAIQYDCSIMTVLHENPGSETGKSRGHLGSQTERKAETNLRLAKDAQGITTVWAERARHAHIPKESGTCFEWNDAAGMHLSCGSAREIKATAKRHKQGEELAIVFMQAEAMTFTELKRRIADALAVADSTAARRIREWQIDGLIRKHADERYQLV